MPLTPKQQRFVAEYLKDLNATQAAIRAGYSRNSAHVQGPRLLGNAAVREAANQSTQRIAGKLNLTAEGVLSDIARLARLGEETGDLHVALKGNELLGKHLKLFTERVEHSGQVSLAQLVTASLVVEEE